MAKCDHLIAWQSEWEKKANEFALTLNCSTHINRHEHVKARSYTIMRVPDLLLIGYGCGEDDAAAWDAAKASVKPEHRK